MSKKISISNRINIGLALTIIFLLVFATNRIDKNHFETVQNALISLHNNRVVAQEYVYNMRGIIHKKRIILIDSTSKENKTDLNKQFDNLINNFATTELTVKEAKTFNNLKIDFEKLKEIEQKRLKNNSEKIFLNTLESDLNDLSAIQSSESKNLISLTQKSLDRNNLISNLEIGFLILIGIILQFTIFYRVKKSKSA
ncbi:hypothetical protein [Polaribacter sargassicola]|uniref:hypothetical protein n=1 Tax=Polaribacter sargassicola TaxID=2836891 RepID=UPI001F24340C|nr:hypothetical protein [Polaribacter sp. DS7-9]MCG1035768.1 hypothetical protein [Polaribacter sp. DS7-9]